MALRVRDRVLEVSTTTGTANISLAGSITGFQTFASGVGNGNQCYYAVVHHDLQNYPQWEVGKGTLSGSTLSRDTILDSSDGPGNKISLSVGVKNVFVTAPGQQLLLKDPEGRVFVGSGTLNPDGDNMLYVDGDIKASGINVESGVIIQQSPAPSPADNKLYNLGGTLYWGSSPITASSESLFNISAGSGTADLSGDVLGINAGSGIFFNGGENVNISMSDLGNGSGQITIDAPNNSTDFLVTAESGLNSISVLQGSGISFVGANGIGVTLTDRTSPSGTGLPVLGGSGIITITGPDLSLFASSAGSGIIIDNGIVHATSGSVVASGIVQLTNTIADDATKALTPKAVNDANYLSSFPITATEGLGHFDVTTVSGVASGILFKSGSNTTVTLSRASSGSGVITIDSTDTTFSVTAGSGIVMDGDNVVRHDDTSTQASVNNTGNSFIQDVTLDEFGHITAINSATATGVGTRFLLGASDGIGNMQLEDGSGIFIVGGSNINVTLSNADGGSGVITIDAPTAVGVSLDGSPTAVSGGIAFFNSATSIAYDSDVVWDSGNSEVQLGGPVKLAQITAPEAGATTDRLYNVGGNLTWNGTNLLGGTTGGAPTTQGSPTPGGSGVAFYTGANTLGYDTGFTWDSGNNRLGINIDNGDPHSTLQSYGSFATKVSAVTDDYSAADEHVILFDQNDKKATGIITLPPASQCDGRMYHIKLIGSGLAERNASVVGAAASGMSFHGRGVKIKASGSETIDGEDVEMLWVEGDCVTLVAATGTDQANQWHVINRDYTPHHAEVQVATTGFRLPFNYGTPIVFQSSLEGMPEVGGMPIGGYSFPSGLINQTSTQMPRQSGVGGGVEAFTIQRAGWYELNYTLHLGGYPHFYYPREYTDTFIVYIRGYEYPDSVFQSTQQFMENHYHGNAAPGYRCLQGTYGHHFESGDRVGLHLFARTYKLDEYINIGIGNVVLRGQEGYGMQYPHVYSRYGFRASKMSIKELR